LFNTQSNSTTERTLSSILAASWQESFVADFWRLQQKRKALIDSLHLLNSLLFQYQEKKAIAWRNYARYNFG